MKVLVFLLLGLAVFGCTTSPTPPIAITPIGAGTNWSDPGTWGGTLPNANSSVTIPEGKTIIIDQNILVKNITVLGNLKTADRDLEIKLEWMMVHGSGVFQISGNNAPYSKKLTLTLMGNNQNENIMGMGSKFLGAMNGGKIEIVGENRTAWTQLGSTATKGSSSINLKEAPDWRVGETIVVASTALDPNQAEERRIVAVNGTTLTLDTPLEYSHFGQIQTIAGKQFDQRAEVGLLSRKVVIEGDAQSTQTKFGGHFMIMGSSPSTRETNPTLRSSAKIVGVEFRRMGQFNRLGRYPLHWHQNGTSTGSFVRSSSVHSSLQRGIVVHGSDDVLVENNISYATPGHSFVLEDGSETGNTLRGNLAILPKAVVLTADGIKDQKDQAAASFWLRTAAAKVIGNTSAGGQFAGFWFDMGFVEGANATKAKLIFSDNTVHSHQGERVPNSEGDTWAVWHTDGFVPSEEGYLLFERLNAYKNARAVETSGRGVVTDSLFADNSKAISQVLLKNSTVVSRSANRETDPEWGATGMFAYGGFANAENVTWVGFNDGRKVSSTLACGIEYPRFHSKSSQLIDSDPTAGCGDIISRDLDGTLSGATEAKTLVAYNPNSSDNSFGLVSPECQKNAALGVAICPNYDFRALGVTYPIDSSFSNPNWQIDVVREQDNNRVTPNHFRWISYVVPGQAYRLEVKSKSAGNTGLYALEQLPFVQLGLSEGDLSKEDLQVGGRNMVYDPNWAQRKLLFSATVSSSGFVVRRCLRSESCDNDPNKWAVVGATASLATLQSAPSSGYARDGNKIHFLLYGGDRLHFVR